MGYDCKALEGLPSPSDPRRVYAAGETPPELARLLLDAIDQHEVEYTQGCDRRRQIVRRALRSKALAGIGPNPDCQKIFDAYITGQIEIVELMPLIRLTLCLDPKLGQKAIEPDFLEMLLADIRTRWTVDEL